MSYPYQITSMDQYQTAYKASVKNRKNSGRQLQKIFYGERNGIKCWNGILRNQK